MKEFIEKLIGQLMKDSRIGRKSYEAVVENIKQFAEEWKKEHDETDYANIELYAFWQKHQWIPVSERLPENIVIV